MVTTTYRCGSRSFEVIRTDRETYIKTEDGIEVVDRVPEWIAHYVAQGFHPDSA